MQILNVKTFVYISYQCICNQQVYAVAFSFNVTSMESKIKQNLIDIRIQLYKYQGLYFWNDNNGIKGSLCEPYWWVNVADIQLHC